MRYSHLRVGLIANSKQIFPAPFMVIPLGVAARTKRLALAAKFDRVLLLQQRAENHPLSALIGLVQTGRGRALSLLTGESGHQCLA